MKYLLLLLFAVSIACCKKDAEPIPPPEEPSNVDSFYVSDLDLQLLAHIPDSFLCTATKEVPTLGQIDWVANCLVRKVGADSLVINFHTYKDTINLFKREDIDIGIIKMKNGRYEYQKDFEICIYSRSADDGDVADGSWRLDTTKSNFFEIKKIDLIKNEVVGIFELHFNLFLESLNGIKYSERINFLDAEFVAKIEE